jgi:hypothetical protein
MARPPVQPEHLAVKVNLTLKKYLKDRLENEARARGMTASELFAIKLEQQSGDLIVVGTLKQPMALQECLDFLKGLSAQVTISQIHGNLSFEAIGGQRTLKIVLDNAPPPV